MSGPLRSRTLSLLARPRAGSTVSAPTTTTRRPEYRPRSGPSRSGRRRSIRVPAVASPTAGAQHPPFAATIERLHLCFELHLNAAQHLFDAHERRERFTPLPPELAPRTGEEGYAIQDAFLALRAQKLGAIVGYKIALSSAEMRRFAGVDDPQAGALLEHTVHRSPARVRAADYGRLLVEFEIAVEMAEDLPAADAPFFRERVAKALDEALASAERASGAGPLVDSRARGRHCRPDGRPVVEGAPGRAPAHQSTASARPAAHPAPPCPPRASPLRCCRAGGCVAAATGWPASVPSYRWRVCSAAGRSRRVPTSSIRA